MKNCVLLFATMMLMLTASCSTSSGSATTDTVATTPVPPTTTTTVATTMVAITTTTQATTTKAPVPALPEVVMSDDLIPEGFPTDDTYHAETDYLSGTSMSLFCEDTGMYYLFDGNLIKQAKTVNSTGTALCTKADCHHNDADCLALVPAGSVLRCIMYHNERVYVTHCPEDRNDYVLTSISTDGSDRRTELQIENSAFSDEGVYTTGYAGRTILHRGRIYFIWMRPVEGRQFTTELWTYKLDNSGTHPQCIYRSVNYIPRPDTGSIIGLGHRLYLFEFINEYYFGELKTLNLLTGEWTVVEAPDGYSIRSQSIQDGSLTVTCQTTEFLQLFHELLEQEKQGKKVEYPEIEAFKFRLSAEGSTIEPYDE